MEETQPSLCEPGVKYFIGCSLKESHKFKEKYINFFYNIGMFVLLFGGVAVFLMFRYKGRISQKELALKNRKKQEYIIGKLQHLASIKAKHNHNMITNLPSWENNPETEMLKRYA